MLKVTILASLFGSLAMGAGVANGAIAQTEKRDSQIIVEVNRDLNSLTEDGIFNTQEIVKNNIRRYVTSNFSTITSYSHIANAFAISVNSEKIDAIRNVPGVKSVTVNKFHAITESIHTVKSGGDNDEYGGTENISAETMHKSDNTNDGEGTVIAILDNEFYFRAEHKDDKGNTVASWNHKTFSDLGNDVTVAIKGHPTNWASTHAFASAKKAGTLLKNDEDLGKEGSLYFNKKVPFYFDYGGEKESYAVVYNEDLDVSTELTYHGSHVASIAAGNDPDYKGIAPKAQLVCMKVFTTTKATDLGKQLGGGTSTGAYDMPILNALEDCITLGVDGINMSLGSNLNDFDSDTITVRKLKELADAGILTSISAGNSGKTSYATTGGYANWTSNMVETGILSGYSNNASATTVASGQPTKLFYEAAFDMDGKIVAYDDQIVNREYYDTEYEKEYKMADLVEQLGTDKLPWVYVPGFGTASDYTGLEVDGKIAVVNRGSTSFADKYAVAKSQRAIALVVINNDPTSTDFNFRMSFGDDFRPSMPCALVLYKDREEFSSRKSGIITLIEKQLVENEKAYSVSTFSSDGATFDLDLKPEITAPGDLIKGAVPPQKKEDRTEDRRYGVYEFLSGTSMSAPNYAGAQSVVLSKEAKDHYDRLATLTDKSEVNKENKAYTAFRKTVDLRLGSTAVPMYDLDKDDNGNIIRGSLTSPRRQGAGMVDLGAAYNTDVYFEGIDVNGQSTGKSKIALRNNADINRGVINDIHFVGYNDSKSPVTFSVTLTVMRPEIVSANDIVTKEYNNCGEVDAISSFPGHVYYIKNAVEGNPPTRYESFGTANHNDVFNVTRDIEYYATAEDCLAGEKTVIKKNRYYNAGDDKAPNWQPLPGKDYQSTKDVVIAEIELADITVNPGKGRIDLVTKSNSSELFKLDGQEKNTVDSFFEYGTYLEGFISFTNKANNSGQPNLSLPFMGFYGGPDKDYGDAPVFEPFSFEKDSRTVYPSDLVNDIGRSLIGKDKIDVQSMWVAGYVKDGEGVNTDEILLNDNNFANLSGFHMLGKDPETDAYYDNAKDNLYVGSSYATNTMIIQQFMLRSVANNYFTITNGKGEVVYKSALEDMLFGADDFGRYALFKSHIDDNYLGAGYLSHKAYAIVPLYDDHGVAFPSGDYEFKFNYLLAGTGEWVSYSYTLHIDSDAPIVTSVTDSGDKLSINIKESNLVSMAVDKDTVDISTLTKVDDNNYRFEISKDDVEKYLAARFNYAQGSGRLFLKLMDRAYGEMGVIIRFGETEDGDYNFADYTLVEHHSLKLSNDFQYDGSTATVVNYNSSTGQETPVTDLEGSVLVSHGPVQEKQPETQKGCGGNVVTTSVTLSSVALVTILALAISKIKRKKVLGGKD